MTEAQRAWLEQHPEFSRIGPPRPIKFDEWGTLKSDGTYERLDNKPHRVITAGDGAIGVCVVKR